jgi:C4-dicarboxylate transporter, DctM subunit
MSLELISAIMIGLLLLLIFIRLEIAFSLGVTAVLGLLLFVKQPLIQIAWSSWSTCNSFTLTAVPLFVFMGSMFANTGVAKSLFKAGDKLIGHVPGGLVISVIGASAVFAATSGSSIASAATFGAIGFPEMEKRGYDPKFALGAIAAGGTLGILIPPSINLIVYGGWENVSVARLFAGGLIPGVILAGLFVVLAIIRVLLKPELAPRTAGVSWGQRKFALFQVLPALGTGGIVLGVIFLGIMTPTEAAAMGAFLSIILAVLYGRFSLGALKDSLLAGVKVTSMIFFIVSLAKVLAYDFQYLEITNLITDFIFGLGLGKYGTLIIIYILYLVLGMLFDALSMMLLTLPFVMPIIGQLGMSPVWFGVTLVVLMEIGLITPPLGLNLFSLRGAVPQHSVEIMAWGALPFIIPLMILVGLVTVFPGIITWLPDQMF